MQAIIRVGTISGMIARYVGVRLLGTHGWSVLLALVEQRSDMGLFRYTDKNGSAAQGWIAMANVRQQAP